MLSVFLVPDLGGSFGLPGCDRLPGDQAGRGFEMHFCLGRNGDGLARPGIPAPPFLRGFLLEGSKPDESDFLVFGEVEDGAENGVDE